MRKRSDVIAAACDTDDTGDPARPVPRVEDVTTTESVTLTSIPFCPDVPRRPDLERPTDEQIAIANRMRDLL